MDFRAARVSYVVVTSALKSVIRKQSVRKKVIFVSNVVPNHVLIVVINVVPRVTVASVPISFAKKTSK